MTDLRLAVRQLLNHPGFTAVALFALSIGIGANVTIFSFVDRLLLRPLALPHADRVLAVWATEQDPMGHVHDRLGVTPADFRDWEQETASFEHLSAFVPWQVEVSGDGEPEQLSAPRVSSDFFVTLGVSPAWGVAFGPVGVGCGHTGRAGTRAGRFRSAAQRGAEAG